MTMHPKVTVGICVRNGEKFIEEAIDTLMLQNFPHDLIRVVFVDDGSTDKTLSIIQRRSKTMDMTTVIQHTSWKGLGSARNTVIANAEGDYILWLDADMILSHDYLSKLLDFAENNPTAGIVKGTPALIPAPNLLATLEWYSRAASKMVNFQSGKAEFKSVGTGGALHRMKALRQSGGFDVDLKGYNEDWDTELRMRKAGWSFHIIDAPLLDYERYGLTWKELWRRYWIRGYHSYSFVHKNKGMIQHTRRFPPAAFLFGLFSSIILFRMTSEKIIFLLPFECAFKSIPWYIGFIRAHLAACAPSLQEA